MKAVHAALAVPALWLTGTGYITLRDWFAIPTEPKSAALAYSECGKRRAVDEAKYGRCVEHARVASDKLRRATQRNEERRVVMWFGLFGILPAFSLLCATLLLAALFDSRGRRLG